MTESPASISLREAGERARLTARWAGPLSEDEREELAARLDRAAARYSLGTPGALYDPARIGTAAECRDLRRDVLGRTGVYR